MLGREQQRCLFSELDRLTIALEELTSRVEILEAASPEETGAPSASESSLMLLMQYSHSAEESLHR